MIEKLASKILKFISAYVPTDEEMNEVYQYGIEITLSTALNIIITMAISLLLGRPLCGVLFLACISSVRSYCGGYHANSYFGCNCAMAALFLTAYTVGMLADYYDFSMPPVEIALLILAFIPLLLFSPVRNVHKELSDRKRKKCRIISFVLYWLFSSAGVLIYSFDKLYGSIIIVALTEISAMILIEIIRQRRTIHEAERNNG